MLWSTRRRQDGIGTRITLDRICSATSCPIATCLTCHQFPEALEAATLFYTPTVAHSPRQLQKEVMVGYRQLNVLHYWMRAAIDEQVVHETPLLIPEATELIIIDEADRLKTAGLEQMRDIYDRRVGLD